MPEDISPSTAAPLAGNVATSPAPAATTTTQEPLAGDSEIMSLEEAKKLRRENQTLRARQKTLDDAEAQRQQEALSNEQKATKRAEDAEAKFQQEHTQHINALVKLAAHAKGIIDPDIAALAIEKSLEFGDDGMPSNLDKALDDLLKNKPYLTARPAEGTPTPAQRAPMIPAMSPGRDSIAKTSLPPGRIPRLTDPGIWKK